MYLAVDMISSVTVFGKIPTIYLLLKFVSSGFEPECVVLLLKFKIVVVALNQTKYGQL